MKENLLERKVSQMSKRRIENRLTVRFANDYIMDEIDIAAAKAGMSAAAWARDAVMTKLRKNDQRSEFSSLHTRKMVEMMVGPKVSEAAKEHTAQYLEKDGVNS